MNHTCLLIKPRETDYILGANSPIVFKAVSDGNWLPRIEFFENQNLGFETNGCVLFTAQESFDAQMDNFIATNVFPQELVQQFFTMGYMDMGKDGLAHFHSSPRFLQVLTGNGFNGNSQPDAWDVMRKYGVLPWKDLPFVSGMTPRDYLTPIPQNLLTKASQFLALLGGKQAIQYHFIVDGDPTNVSKMISALPQAPLCIGINTGTNWNQVQPSLPTDPTPEHSVMNYSIDNFVEIYDHYQPAQKELSKQWPMHYVLQGVIVPILPIATVAVSETELIANEIATAPISNADKFSLLNLVKVALIKLANLFGFKD